MSNSEYYGGGGGDRQNQGGYGNQGQGGYGNQGQGNYGNQGQGGYGNQGQGGYGNQGQGGYGNQGQGGYDDSGNGGQRRYGDSDNQDQRGSNYGGQGQGDHRGGSGGYGNDGQGGYGDPRHDFREAADRASQHGGSEDSSLYHQAMGFLSDQFQQGHLNDHSVDEDELVNSHRQAHDDQGRPQQVSDPKIAGQAGAMEALKQLNSSGAGGKSQSDFIGQAMSQVSKFMGGNMSGQDKQSALQQAAKTAFMLYMKTKGVGAGSSAAGGLGGLLSGGGSGGGMGNLMGLAAKFL